MEGKVLSKTTSNLSHDADLSELYDYFETWIIGSLKAKYKYERLEIKKQKDRDLDKKMCSKVCNDILFSYSHSVISKHPNEAQFGRRLMDLEYRYCRDCRRLMPKSVILEREDTRVYPKTIQRTPSTPVRCPCCRNNTARVEVFIRRTKMAELLFEGEGY